MVSSGYFTSFLSLVVLHDLLRMAFIDVLGLEPVENFFLYSLPGGRVIIGEFSINFFIFSFMGVAFCWSVVVTNVCRGLGYQ